MTRTAFIAVTLIAVIVGLACYGLLSFSDSPLEKRILPTRDDLTRRIMGKHQDDVSYLMGPAARIDGNPDEVCRWFYEDACYDPATKRVDKSVEIVFTKRIVTKIVP
jgi:hypothetical protein